MGRPMLSSLRSRLFLLVAFALIPALAALVYSGMTHRRIAGQLAEKRVLHLTRMAAAEHDRMVSEMRALLETLTELPQIQQQDSAVCGMLFSGLMAKHPGLSSLILSSPGGETICSVPPKKGLHLADRPYFQQALTSGRLASSQFLIGRITGEPAIAFALPVLDRHGEARSVLVAGVNLHRWSLIFTAEALPPGWSFTVFDEEGTVLLRFPDAAGWIGKSVGGKPLFRDILARGGEGVLEAEGLDDTTRIYALTTLKLPSGKCYLAAGIPAGEVFAESGRLLYINLLVIAVVALLCFAGIEIGSRLFLLHPVKALVTASRRMAVGELSARTGLPFDRSEIGQLAEAFDTMAKALEQHAAELQARQAKVDRLNRVYAVLSGINGSLLRLRERDELLSEACRIAVERGGFRLTWVGMIDTEMQRVKVAAGFGPAIGYVNEISISTQEEYAEGRCPVGLAVREGASQICNDVESDPRLAPWREATLSHGIYSMAAFPLRMESKVVGSLNFYAGESNFFDEEEVRLLEELTADTSLGLEIIGKEEKLEYLAYYDVMTALPNRALFEERLARALARARGTGRLVGLATLKIDRFKGINERQGLPVGDLVLRETAASLSRSVRESDTVARLGGNIFGLILADVADLEDLPAVINKIVDGFPGSPALAAKGLFLTASLGISIFPDDGDESQILLKNALAAMNWPKPSYGTSFQFFAADIHARALERNRIEVALHAALEKEEFSVFFQPIAEADSRRIVGAEALLRWNSSDLGNVSPAKFIPVAEETGLIIPIGEWVFQSVCREAQKWREEGRPPIRFSINVSGRQLSQPNFVERVREILLRTHAGAEQICLAIELTETEMMEQVEDSLGKLSILRELGFEIYIDDFGTGYSSLSYLKKLPVNRLKIDISFVRDITFDPEAATIAGAIIALAHSLGLQVIAEGIEQEEQLALLNSLGCDAFQGYLLSRPVPIGDFRNLVPTS